LELPRKDRVSLVAPVPHSVGHDGWGKALEMMNPILAPTGAGAGPRRREAAQGGQGRGRAPHLRRTGAGARWPRAPGSPRTQQEVAAARRLAERPGGEAAAARAERRRARPHGGPRGRRLGRPGRAVPELHVLGAGRGQRLAVGRMVQQEPGKGRAPRRPGSRPGRSAPRPPQAPPRLLRLAARTRLRWAALAVTWSHADVTPHPAHTHTHTHTHTPCLTQQGTPASPGHPLCDPDLAGSILASGPLAVPPPQPSSPRRVWGGVGWGVSEEESLSTHFHLRIQSQLKKKSDTHRRSREFNKDI
jgi:hypothetical protein